MRDQSEISVQLVRFVRFVRSPFVFKFKLSTLQPPPTPLFTINQEIIHNAIKNLHKKGKFTPEMLAEPEGKALVEENYRILSDAKNKGIKKAESVGIKYDIPQQLTQNLNNNAYIFSGFKTYHTLKEASISLTNKEGAIKTFNEFKQEAEKVFKEQNLNLQAEYRYAVQSAQMAVKWNDIEQDGDKYDLQYRTAGDGNVREKHAQLEGTTLPPSDEFWKNFYPPNGWGCRCTAVQVRKDKYPTSSSVNAIEQGNAATATPSQKIFRTNTAAQQKLFPDKHPYFPKNCNNCENKNTLNLATPVDGISDKCRACKIIVSQSIKNQEKSKSALQREKYLSEMKPLLDKKVMLNGNGHDMEVGFTKYGNKHLYSDTFGRSKTLTKSDLKDVDKLLENSKFLKKVGLSKDRTDGIKRFYYYEAKLHGKVVYLNVAENEVVTKKGKIWHSKFLYSITDKIKSTQ